MNRFEVGDYVLSESCRYYLVKEVSVDKIFVEFICDARFEHYQKPSDWFWYSSFYKMTKSQIYYLKSRLSGNIDE